MSSELTCSHNLYGYAVHLDVHVHVDNSVHTVFFTRIQRHSHLPHTTIQHHNHTLQGRFQVRVITVPAASIIIFHT